MSEPRVERTKEEIAREMEVARKGKIVVHTFYPALTAATVSIDEAKMLLRAISTLMMEEVMKTMKERKFSDISPAILKVLTEDGERVEEIKELLAVFEKENLFVSREIIEGMSNAIEQMLIEDQQGRTLDTLKPDWSKMLSK